MLDLIVLHGEFSLFTVRGNFWYQIYRNRRKKVLCSRLSLITLTTITCTEINIITSVYQIVYIRSDSVAGWCCGNLYHVAIPNEVSLRAC